MKTEDFKKLKDLCENLGLDITPAQDSTLLITKKKDEWEGVEFAETKKDGFVYKITKSSEDSIKYYLRGLDGYDESQGTHYEFSKKYFKPSTEQAYVEQLKKEAFERFGEINEGDRFDCGEGAIYDVSRCGNNEWHYYKSTDQLFRYNVEIYCAGKWAKRVPEMVEVEGYSSNGSQKPSVKTDWSYSFHFELKNYRNSRFGAKFMHEEVLPFLAEQLEKYLNNEIE